MGQARSVRIGLAGCGTVGTGVLNLLDQQRDEYVRRFGLRFEIAHVVVRDPGRSRSVNLSPDLVTADPQVLQTPEVDVVIELIGGTGGARDVVLSAVRGGKPVVTANKALIALHGPELFKAAAEAGVPIGFEAACCAGLPILGAIRRGLASNRIDSLYGILNGTCNYILSEMPVTREPYSVVLADAQRLGFAEADPTLDVDGTDSAHKLAILAALAFGQPVDFQRVHVEGIESLELQDLLLAAAEGYVVKLLGIARREPAGLTLAVVPALVRDDAALARVPGPYNAVSVFGRPSGHTFYLGRGAGAGPTASAVVSDLIAVASEMAAVDHGSGMPWLAEPLPESAYAALDELPWRYYLRAAVDDVPGVENRVAAALAGAGIRTTAVTRHQPSAGLSIPDQVVVAQTEPVADAAVRAGLQSLRGLGDLQSDPVSIRIVPLRDEHRDA